MGFFDKVKKLFKKEKSEDVKDKYIDDAASEKELIDKPNIIEEDNSKKYIEESIPDKTIDDEKSDSIEDTDISNKEYEELSKEAKVELDKYDKGLSKTRNDFTKKINFLGIKYTKIDESFFEELEEILIMSDIGVKTVMDFMDRLRSRVKSEHIEDFEYLKEVIIDELFIIYVGDNIIDTKLKYDKDNMNVYLFVGVNGVGKTTTIAKIAHKLKKEGKKVMLIAGDTFRAGAVEQLKLWAKKVGVDFYGEDSKDPAAVIFDGLNKAKEEKCDVVLVDTAGRLQNKINLMKELEKINKVIEKFVPNNPIETLLVIDASTGQNGISQAKSFSEITNITGIVLTKLDGTAKGGIVLAIKESVNIPVKFVGLGEKEDDLLTFDIEKYIYGLFSELED